MARHGLTLVHFDGLTVERPTNAVNPLAAPAPSAGNEPTDDELLSDPYAGLEVNRGS